MSGSAERLALLFRVAQRAETYAIKMGVRTVFVKAPPPKQRQACRAAPDSARRLRASWLGPKSATGRKGSSAGLG